MTEEIRIRAVQRVQAYESSLGRLPRQLGFTCEKPLYRVYQQNPERVEAWKKRVYSQIQKRAKKEKAVICFEDESGVRPDLDSGKT